MRSAVLTIAVALAGCTPMEWYRPDVSAADTEEEAKQCQEQAWRATAWSYPYAPYPYWGPFGRRYWGPWASPYNDRFMEEARLADFCMQAKGYRLERTQK
jgi:hypothetical protein